MVIKSKMSWMRTLDFILANLWRMDTPCVLAINSIDCLQPRKIVIGFLLEKVREGDWESALGDIQPWH